MRLVCGLLIIVALLAACSSPAERAQQRAEQQNAEQAQLKKLYNDRQSPTATATATAPPAVPLPITTPTVTQTPAPTVAGVSAISAITTLPPTCTVSTPASLLGPQLIHRVGINFFVHGRGWVPSSDIRVTFTSRASESDVVFETVATAGLNGAFQFSHPGWPTAGDFRVQCRSGSLEAATAFRVLLAE
jgi:hypothetical protein